MKTYYITTPIYYPSDKLHIGHSYTTTAADAIARYKKAQGYTVTFLTGTDEHGQKIERTAREKGITPQAHVDGIVTWIKQLWKTMHIEYDIFLRTTDPKHQAAVQKIFKKLYAQGDIYKKDYEGRYCTPCETFFTERQLNDGNCPDCGRAVELVREESYFFRLSKYQAPLMKHIEENPDFIMPVYRKNEMVNNFLKPGLEDLCVSRTSFTWGIPVDFDPGHVVYVWVDALSNYITALGYLSEDDSAYKTFWPADVHLVAKEIVRFHTIIWPALLLALGEPLPKQVFGHGWLVFDGDKMSKSKGNVIDPFELIALYGVDAIRYFLLREFAFGQDGNFSNDALVQRINADLANDLGNLVSRTVGMIDKYFGGVLPGEREQTAGAYDAELRALACALPEKVEKHMDKFMFSEALSEIWQLISRANKYADENQPWVLVKDESRKAELANVLYHLAETLRIVAILIQPVMPNTPKAIYTQLNIHDAAIGTWESARTFGLLPRAVRITKGPVLFPRIPVKKETAAVSESVKPPAAASADTAPVETEKPEIGIDDFAKIALKVGTVLACEPIAKTKLLKSQVRIGTVTRQIVSGIANHYSPESMIGKKVIVVTNLKPVKLRGVWSEGMLLAAEDTSGVLNMVTVDGHITDGAEVR